MSFSKIEELNTLNLFELEKKLLDLKKEILNLKIKQVTMKKIKPHLFKHLKHTISQIMFYKSKLQK